MQIGDPRDGFFYPTLTLMIDSYTLIQMLYIELNLAEKYRVFQILLSE